MGRGAILPLSLPKDSHAIAKMSKQPKIRIVHIFAPEIIQTDVGNFRHLVQRLTGKPARRISGKKRPPPPPQPSPPPPCAADAVDEEERRVEGMSGGFLDGLEEGEEDGFFQGLADFSSSSSSSSCFTSSHVNVSY